MGDLEYDLSWKVFEFCHCVLKSSVIVVEEACRLTKEIVVFDWTSRYCAVPKTVELERYRVIGDERTDRQQSSLFEQSNTHVRNLHQRHSAGKYH